MKKLLIALAVLLLAGGGLYFSGMLDSLLGSEETAAETGPPPKVAAYLPMDPPFVVNFTHRGALRYLQLSVELMFYDAARLELAKQSMPAIRNDIIILLSGKDFDSLSTIEAKEQLRKEILGAICKVLELDYDTVVAQDEGTVYITNFITRSCASETGKIMKTIEMIEAELAGSPESEVDAATLLNVPITVTIEIGRKRLPIAQILELREGSVIELDRNLDEPLDILVNGALIAHGVIVLVKDKFGIQITDILSPKERALRLR